MAIHPLAAYRKRHSLTQQALADRLAAANIKTSQQAIDRYESWTVVPRTRTLRRIAAFLGVSAGRLLPDHDMAAQS